MQRQRTLSVLATDKYKPVMAAAGFPRRRETFVLSFRRGGPFRVPMDLAAWVQERLPRVETADVAWMESQGIPAGGAYLEALAGDVVVRALPRGAWFLPGEPVLTVSGPSALVSTLEAVLLGLRFPIQIALGPGRGRAWERATCDSESDLIAQLAFQSGGRAAPRVDRDGYQEAVAARVKELIEAVEDPARLVEVGLRAASTLEQHDLALDAARSAGLVATSHLAGAKRYGLIPAGTTGHEHGQRWGSDPEAFAAARDSLAGDVTYLLDTYSTLDSGLPAALAVLAETPSRRASVRLDCEATMAADFAETVHALRRSGLGAGIVLGGGLDAARVRGFEVLRRDLEWPAEKLTYLVGQSLVAPHVPLPTRSEIGAVYKLSRSAGRATMKFSDDAGKASIPGQPVVLRRVVHDPQQPFGLVAQSGEDVPDGYLRLDQLDFGGHLPRPTASDRVEASPATRALIQGLAIQREAALAAPTH